MPRPDAGRARVWTIGHGMRAIEELLDCLLRAEVATLVDVRRYPASRRNPQFNQAALAEALSEAGIRYRHAVELGGRLDRQPGEERFGCLAAFASYAARMGTEAWQEALARELPQPGAAGEICFMCAETLWWKCHRRLIADLLVARGHEVLHLVRRNETNAHRLGEEAEIRAGRLYLCGELVA